jgi:IS605 OrfB family transposase
MSIVTRKIQLLISDYNKSDKLYNVVDKKSDVYENTWKELNKLNFYCPKISNLVSSKLIQNTNFLNDKFVDNKENKRDNAYQIGLSIINELKIDFKGYSEILNCTCRNSTEKLKNDKKDILKGERSIATFKKGNPIYFQSRNKSFIKQDCDYYITLFNLHFKLNFGIDRSNNKHYIEEINRGIYKFLDSSIQIKNGKIFLLLSIQIPEKQNNLDKGICMGVDLGLSVPAYLALNSNKHYRRSLGKFKDYTKRRLAMQGVYRRKQIMDVGVNGKGIKKKNERLKKYQELEKNYCNTYEHRITKLIIDEAIRNKAGTIKLENLKGFNKEFGLRNWGYFGYQTKIQQKAQQNGIDVVFINPKNTSKTCYKCGNVNELLDCMNKNKQMNNKREWICPNCGETLQRDWNAAYNIAVSTNYKEK